MAGSRSALALVSICILASLSGLGNCRVPFQREEFVARVGEKEQSDHLLLPSEKEEFKEIAREAQPLSLTVERPDLSGNDGIFHGERSRGFRFGRPGGCHHGKFNRRGHRKSEYTFFPVEFLDVHAESRDFHPRMDRPLPEKRDFDPGFSRGEWKHPEGEKRGDENEHMPFPARRGWLEFVFHPFPRHDDPADRDFRPRMDRPLPEKRDFDPGFSKGEWRHPEGRKENEHMPSPAIRGWLEFFFHPFPRHDDPADRDFRPRMDRPLPEKRDFDPGFSKGEWRHPEGRKENEHMPFPAIRGWLEFFFHPFPRHDHPAEFHPRVDEFRPEFFHGFPYGGERRQHRDETGERKRDNEHMPFPEEQKQSFPHAFPVQPEFKEFHSRVEEFMPLPRERDFEHGFPGREGRHEHGHRDEEKENDQMPFLTDSFTYTFPVQAESTEFRSRVEEFLPLPGGEDFEHSSPGREKVEQQQQHRGPFKTE
ncbi:hypothetical protein SUGI_0974950 [Cryptomeria japonica]|nr:hypothetical protein SUGI_0974950 [Cryptomeria japonica]